MRSRFSGLALALCLSAGGLSAGAPAAWAQPKNKKAAGSVEVGADKSIEKQSAWEQKVMGEDGAKQADAKKIAAAQKLAEEARKNPPPEPVKKHKDPNKEGARAKNEASIGLPIESEQAEAQKTQAKKAALANGQKKAAQGSSSAADDELGALVAASLASDRKGGPPSSSSSATADNSSSRGRKGRGKAAAKADSGSSLDRMFSAGK